jgi:pimeloyl-ACP methyl ester carboxylesterase
VPAPATWVSSVVDGWAVATVDGPAATLLWLHGLGEHAATFAPAIAALPEHRHLLLDLPGHGGARAAPGPRRCAVDARRRRSPRPPVTWPSCCRRSGRRW